ncbi:MAG: DUF2970 domain-containing protein [Panacagrimonas sp.]
MSSTQGQLDNDHRSDPPVGLLTTIGSVLAGFFGVQSSRARVRDFTRGSPALFVGVALVLTAALVFVLFGLVQLILLQTAGGT